MAIAITSIGAKVSYAFEESKGAGRPTAGYKNYQKVKEIPEMNPTPILLKHIH